MKLRHSLIALLFLALGACGNGDSSSTITTTTKLISTSLQAQALRLPQGLTTGADNCGDSVTQCLTPMNVVGKVYYAGVMIGNEQGYSLGPIVGDVVDASQITAFPEADLLTFDLSAQLEVGGGIVCCGGSPYPEDADAIASRIEIYFAYIDVIFSLTAEDGVGEALVDTHQIRTVYGDVEGTELKKGDLLYLAAGEEEYRWCTTTEGCVHTTRPESPIQNEAIASYSGSSDGLGNQTIPTFAIGLADGHETITITETEVLNNSFLFTIDFDMANAIGFTEDLTAADMTIVGMIQAFDLRAEPAGGDNGFTATIDVELTPLETPREQAPEEGEGEEGGETI